MSGRFGSWSALALAVGLGGAAPAPGQDEAAAPVAATVAGKPITAKDVDDVVRAQLMDLRAREHQLRSQALDALVAQALIEKEAETRGTTPEALYEAEVEAKAGGERRGRQGLLRREQGPLRDARPRRRRSGRSRPASASSARTSGAPPSPPSCARSTR